MTEKRDPEEVSPAKFRSHLTRLTRRRLLAAGGQAALGASLGLGLGALPGPAQLLAIDWRKWFEKEMPDDSGTVKLLEGQARIKSRGGAGKSLHVGDNVPSGAVVSVSPGGRMVIGLMDGGIFTLSGGAELELFLDRMRRGVLNLLAGALLLVTPKGSQYLVAGSDAAFGIKGTVVFRQVFGPGEKTGMGMDGPLRLPPEASSYFCTCIGDVDVFGPEGDTPYHAVHSEYHQANLILPREPGQEARLQKAPMLNHFDEDVRRLVSLQDEPRHDISWLRH